MNEQQSNPGIRNFNDYSTGADPSGQLKELNSLMAVPHG